MCSSRRAGFGSSDPWTPSRSFEQIALDRHEVLFVIALAVLAPLLFSLAPALSALRTDSAVALNASGSRAVGSGRRVRDGLVALQLALTAALAVVGGLGVRTVSTIVAAPTGFEAANLVKFVVGLDQSTDAEVRRQAVSGLVAGLASQSELRAAAIDSLPAAESESRSIVEPDGVATLPQQVSRSAYVTAIDVNALHTLAVPLLEGQMFAATDVERGAAVALVSAEAARRIFGNSRAALGRRLTIRKGSSSSPTPSSVSPAMCVTWIPTRHAARECGCRCRSA